MLNNQVEYILGNEDSLFGIRSQHPYEIFSEQTVEFLDNLSARLRGRCRADFDLWQPGENDGSDSERKQSTARKRRFPDVAAFGFWCRRASVLEMKKRYLRVCAGAGNGGNGGDPYCNAGANQKTGANQKNYFQKSGTDLGEPGFRLGRGVSLHVVSSNVPVLFGFSMASALLAGNCVLLRLPSKRTPQEDLIVEALRAVMDKLPTWKERIVLFRSPHDREITDALSTLCDVRVIWGGDRAVKEIRQSPLPPRALELPFADRRSAAVFSASAVLKTEDLSALVRGFYNDTYLNDQNACSSPHLLFWLGDDAAVSRAKERFWDAVAQNHFENAGLDVQIQPAVAVKKWEQALFLAAKSPVRISRCGGKVSEASAKISKDGNVAERSVQNFNDGNLAIIIEPKELTPQIWEETVPGGFFFQSAGTDLAPLLPVLSRKVQTLCCFGVNRRKLAARLVAAGVTGVDRIVDVGHALDFSLVWDGMDLIGQMSREITV